jgi:signal transduction histidine kinase
MTQQAAKHPTSFSRQLARSPLSRVLREFNAAFAVMSLIPLLICCWLIAARFYSIDILVGLNGVYFFFAVACAAVGLGYGRRLIVRLLRRLIEQQERLHRLSADLDRHIRERTAELSKTNAMLKESLEQRREIEEELCHRQQELERRVDERTEKLQHAQLQLIQAAKMESIGRLAAGVAHEVKNPLATLLIGIDHLADHFPSADGNLRQLLQDMSRAVRRADAVIKGLLDFSSPETLERSDEDLNAVLDQALALVKHELDKRHVSVTKDLGARLPRIRLDRTKVEQVFVNCCMNAIEAMPEGGTLSVSTGVGPHIVTARIWDTGPGVPEHLLPNIFDPFFTTKRPGRGTGLGLTVTKKIIELHGGTITARNRSDGGLEMALAFPLEKGGTVHGHGNSQAAHSAH